MEKRIQMLVPWFIGSTSSLLQQLNSAQLIKKLSISIFYNKEVIF